MFNTITRLPEALSFIVAMVMVVMGGMCVQSTYHGHTHYCQASVTVIVSPEAVQIKAPRLTIYPVTAQEVSTREHEQWASWGICISPILNCLRLFVAVIYCCHGDGSDGKHVFKVSRPYV